MKKDFGYCGERTYQEGETWRVSDAAGRGFWMRSHYIIDSSASLLGVSLLIVTAVHITGKAATGIADEISFGAALLFLAACGVSHSAIRKSDERYERFADYIFVTGLLLLLCGVLTFWF
jgi:hypothetical protein